MSEPTQPTVKSTIEDHMLPNLAYGQYATVKIPAADFGTWLGTFPSVMQEYYQSGDYPMPSDASGIYALINAVLEPSLGTFVYDASTDTYSFLAVVVPPTQ